MDKVIEVKVNGSYLTKDNVNGGVQGEANSTWLRLAFDESWDGLTKTIVWWDAKGESAAARILTVDMLEDILADTRTYLAPVPNEATIVSGKCMFGIDGYINGKRQRSVYGQLVIAPGPDGTDETIEQPTPTQAEQLQSQLEVLLGRIENVAINAKEAEASAKEAASSATESRSWAAGGTGTREGEDTNNARYWAELTKELFDIGEGEAGVAITLGKHISNREIHITGEERAVWNNKPNPNLLDNWYFADPIDQRQGYVVGPGTAYYSDTGLGTQAGTTDAYLKVEKANDTYGSITVSGTTYYVAWSAAVRGYARYGYGIDRWRLDNNSGATLIEMTEDGLRFINSSASTGIGAVFQSLDETVRKTLAGQTVTYSMLGKATRAQQLLLVVNGSVLAGSSASIRTTLDQYTLLTKTITLPDTISSVTPFFYGNSVSGVGEGYIYAVKLELGPVQTLAHQDADGNWVLNDPPPNRALELAKCQRYYEKSVWQCAFGFSQNANYITYTSSYFFKNTKRAMPAITVNPAPSQSLMVHNVETGTMVSDAELVIPSAYNMGMYCPRVYSPSGAFEINKLYRIIIGDNAYLVDANL